MGYYKYIIIESESDPLQILISLELDTECFSEKLKDIGGVSCVKQFILKIFESLTASGIDFC